MIDIDDGDYVACICEGHSEITIMNLLGYVTINS